MTCDLTPFLSVIKSTGDERVDQRRTAVTLKMQLVFIDDSILYVRENVIRDTLEIDYAYQWQTAAHQLIIRWDNAHAVNLPTSPHHCHLGSEENILPSEKMTLEKVLDHIAATLPGQ